MKTLILSSYSEKLKELNSLTAPNKEAYARKHGYTFLNVLLRYDIDGHLAGLKMLKGFLEDYDVVMTAGCDVLFMNFSINVESKRHPHLPTLAKEHISWWPINNDVMIWPSTKFSKNLIAKLIEEAPVWKDYPWLWQAHLWDLMQVHPIVNLVAAREMNSTWREGLSKWQLGDWILHALDADISKKIDIIKAYLPFAGSSKYADLPNSIRSQNEKK